MNSMINHFLIYIFIYILLIFKILCKIVYFEFNELYSNSTELINRKNNNYLFSNDDDITYFSNKYENIIYTIIKIGNTDKYTMCIFNPNTNIFSINNQQNCNIKPEYNFSLSESSKIIEKINGDDYFPGYYIIKDFIKLTTIKDNIKNLETINDFSFRFDEPHKSWGNEDKNDKIFCGEIGIQLNQETKVCSKFIKYLKDKDIIDSYTITLNYLDKSGGYIYIGGYPHDYFPDKFKESQLISTYIIPKSSFSQLRILMDNIYIKINETNKINIYSNEIYFHLESGIIECPTEYFNKIKNIFFNKYLTDNICTIKSMTRNLDSYNMIVCENNITFDLKSFPSLHFYHFDLNYNFSLSYKDLFEKKNDKFYFQIIYSTFSGSYWKLGKPFLKKYQITLNLDAKTINFYNNNQKDEKNISTESNYNKNFIFLIICSFLFISLFIVSYLLLKKIKAERQKRANELKDDEYQYNSQNEEKFESNKNKNLLEEETDFYKNSNIIN